MPVLLNFGVTSVEPFIPIQEALRRSDLMIGNGGTATVLASLVAGVPYLAIYKNLDQALAAEQYRLTGAVDGELSLRAIPERIRKGVDQMLQLPAADLATKRCKNEFNLFGGDHWSIHQLRKVINLAQKTG